jgi:hypothetical protein
MANESEGTSQGGDGGTPDKPQSYGTQVVQRGDLTIEKPVSYGTRVVNESEISGKK